MKYDLDTTPCDEECAQLGHTPQYGAIARGEAHVYAAALQAFYGPAPAGTRFAAKSNQHDFGTYYSLEFIVDTVHTSEIRHYADQLEQGLNSWLQAGFCPPYDHSAPHGARCASLSEAVLSAMAVSRPNPDGRFPYPDAERLHTNLRSAFPAYAAAYDQQLAA